MTNGPVRGDWNLAGAPEPATTLLLRAVAHVEQLLERLEYTETSEANQGPTAVDPMQPVVVDEAVATAAERVLAAAARPQVRAFTSTQADVLRIALNAHEEANRLRAEAGRLYAETTTEGRLVLAELQEMVAQLKAEAQQDAARMQAEVRRTAERLRSEAEEAAVQIGAEAKAAAQTLRDAAHEAAARTHTEIESWCTERLRSADEASRRRFDAPARDMERIRMKAFESGHAEAATQIELEHARLEKRR